MKITNMENNGMYNTDKKEMFIKNLGEDSKTVYNRIFKLSNELEVTNNKDLYNFTEEELVLFIKDVVKPSTKESARTYSFIIQSYIDWAINNDLSVHLINPIKKSREFFYGLIEDKKEYMTREEVELIVDNLFNAQDSVPVLALFEGIGGSQLSEIRNLTVNDYNELEQTVVLKNNKDNSARELEVSKKLIDLIKVAKVEDEYFKMNGDMDTSSNVKDVIALPDSIYILKSGRANNVDKVMSQHTLYNRLEMIRELPAFKEFKECLKPKSIIKSGMIYLAKQILDRDGKLERKQLEEVCGKFGVKYNWNVKDFLNIDTINSLYK